MNLAPMRWMKIVLLIAAFLTAYLFLQTDEQKVQRRFNELLDLISKQEREGIAAQALRRTDMLACFGTNLFLEFDYPFPETMTREEFGRVIQYVRHQATTLELKKTGTSLSRLGDGSFQMETTIEASIVIGGDQESYLGSFELLWEEQKGKWVLAGGRQLEVITHPSRNAQTPETGSDREN